VDIEFAAIALHDEIVVIIFFLKADAAHPWSWIHSRHSMYLGGEAPKAGLGNQSFPLSTFRQGRWCGREAPIWPPHVTLTPHSSR